MPKSTTRKTLSLIGKELDWAAAKALGLNTVIKDDSLFVLAEAFSEQNWDLKPDNLVEFKPSTNFGIGGEIINKLGIDVRQYKKSAYQILDPRHYDLSKGDELRTYDKFNREMVFRPNAIPPEQGMWFAKAPTSHSSTTWSKDKDATGDTFLVAAMRQIAHSHFGEFTEIPNILNGVLQ